MIGGHLGGKQPLAFAGWAMLGFALVATALSGLARTFGWQPPPGSATWQGLHPLQVGVNVTGITHYGYGDLFPKATQQDVDADLTALKRMGASVVRVFPAFDGITAAEAAARLDRFLSRAEPYHIAAIVSFINYYGSRQNPAGLDRYYTESWRGIPHLNHEFMAGGYRGAYLDFVRTVVQENRRHPNVFAWEPGNELQDADRQAFLSMMKDVSTELRQLDARHPVSSGLIDAAQTGFSADELYSHLPNVGIITVHPGNGYRGSAGDVDWAVSHGTQAIVEETGFSTTADRTAGYAAELAFWWRRGVSAFLLDGFVAKGLPDNGNGDTELGFDALWHTDYDGLAALLRSASHPWPWQALQL